MDQIRWVAFFSQTGGEIADIAEKLGRWPDVIVTNARPKSVRTLDPRLEDKGVKVVTPRPTLHDYRRVLQNPGKQMLLVTLHGWLHIVPEQIVNEYEIFNGHPGLITKYPELKGKDPQQRAINGGYKICGSVIHKVIPAVDEGEILYSKQFFTKGLNTDQIYSRFKEVSLDLWIEFFNEK
jgi:folate-dependent phosphoribosylglycinamide formyltransferase PurN